MSRLTAFCVPALLAAGIVSSARAQVPRPSPEYSTLLPDGRHLLLSELRGKVVALEFLSTTCHYCKECSAVMNKLYAEYGPKGFQPLGVAINPNAIVLVPGYTKELGLNFPVGVGPHESALSYLRFSTLDRLMVPQLVFIDRRGVIRAHYPGGDPFFKDEEKNMRAQIEALLQEPAGSRKRGAVRKNPK